MEIVYSDDLLKKYGYTKINPITSYDNPEIYEGQNNENIECPKEKDTKIIKKNNGVRIVSYNVHNFTTICTDDKLKRDIKKFMKLFKKIDADVIALQEVIPINKTPIYEEHYNYASFDYLIEEFKKNGYKYNIICNTMKDGLKTKEKKGYYFLGNAVFSKIEFTGKCYQLPMNRGFILCDFKKFKLVNIHGEYWSDDLLNHIIPDEFNKDLIKYQWNLVENILKDINDLIIVGDFNIPYKIWDNDIFKRIRYRDIKNRMRWIRNNFIDAHNTKYPIEKRITNLRQNIATDFIMIKNNSKINYKNPQIIKSNLSDHFPISIDLLIKDIQ